LPLPAPCSFFALLILPSRQYNARSWYDSPLWDSLFGGFNPFPAQALLGRFSPPEDDAFPRFDNFRHSLTFPNDAALPCFQGS
jgi:hypothetical protein